WLAPARTVGAAGLYVVIAAASGWIGDRFAHGTPTQLIGDGAGGMIVGTAAAISAGVTEELVLLSLAAAVVRQALRDRPRLVLPVTLAVLIVLRWSIHLHYGTASVFVLFWVPAAYALFRWTGSVWPLVIGHAAYDV